MLENLNNIINSFARIDPQTPKNQIQIIALLLACFLSGIANAGIISYKNYTHDESTNFVIGNSLEWLQWDVTIGQSIDQALGGIATTYDGGGWRLASNVEMSSLFNTFDFGMTFTPAESITQSHTLAYDSINELGPHNTFIDMFGDTYAAGGYFLDNGDPFRDSRAYYGSDADDDNHYNIANVSDDYIERDFTKYGSKAELVFDDWFPSSRVYGRAGVALVREIPAPSTFYIFTVGLLFLYRQLLKNATTTR